MQTTGINGMVENATSIPSTAPALHGYGLPCAKCRTYYDSNLSICPVCKTAKRVAIDAIAVRTVTPETRDSAAVEEERRRLAQEFTSQAYAPSLTVPAIENAVCALDAHHLVNSEPPTVCQACYTSLQSQADLMEAALHIDLKEAAQVIYEAVWADPSDPTKTYQNAAHALLAELHKRAGISAVLAPIHPMSH
jgi:hypothetical protein